jgi:peptidoglycan hydrolase-like protein with peptidoglycan-binding domain
MMKKISLVWMTMFVLFFSSQADARRLKQGMRGNDVKQWQIFLRKRGYKPGAADGIYGRQTVIATMNFQKKYKIKIDGIVGPQTTRKAMSQGYQHFHDHQTVPLDCC